MKNSSTALRFERFRARKALEFFWKSVSPDFQKEQYPSVSSVSQW